MTAGPHGPGAAGRARSLRVVDVIRRKRDGGELTREEISYLVSAYTDGAIPDYPCSAVASSAASSLTIACSRSAACTIIFASIGS